MHDAQSRWSTFSSVDASLDYDASDDERENLPLEEDINYDSPAWDILFYGKVRPRERKEAQHS